MSVELEAGDVENAQATSGSEWPTAPERPALGQQALPRTSEISPMTWGVLPLESAKTP